MTSLKEQASFNKLSLVNVCKSFQTETNKIEVLKNINLEITPGEFLCLTGLSGCGKSTLLNLIAGLDDCDSGSITLDGEKINGTGPERLVIFQDGALFPWLSVAKNIEFGFNFKYISPSEKMEKINNILNLVGLIRFKNYYPHQLSGGMKQRVALARALVLDPKILLMDEPFSALDAQTREALYNELQLIWIRTGKTILFVTHNTREAACLADRIILMKPNPGEIYKEYTVNQKRPRIIEDNEVMNVSRLIHSDIKSLKSNEESVEI